MRNSYFLHFTKILSLLFLGLVLNLSSLKAQMAEYILPVSGIGEKQTACAGTLYDDGGPTGNFSGFASGYVTIEPQFATKVRLNFTDFDLGSFGYLYIYKGEGFNEYYGSYTGAVKPNGDGIVEIDAKSVTIQLSAFVDFGTQDAPGFKMTWEGTDGAGNPEASFVIADNNLLSYTEAFFMNTSSGAINATWDFGDGSSSTQFNPSHIYTAPGTYTVKLTVEDCFNNVMTSEQVVTVSDLAGIAVSPTEGFNVALAYGDSTTRQLTISSNGLGDLTYQIPELSLISQKKTQVVALTNYADMNNNQEYKKTIAAIQAFYSYYTVTNVNAGSGAELQNALKSAAVLLIPEQEACNNAPLFAEFAPVVQAFAESGGTVIVNGTEKSECLLNLGLFQGTYKAVAFNENLVVADAEDELLEGTDTELFKAYAATYYYDFTNTDLTRVLEYKKSANEIYDVLCYRNVGEGRAIFIGFDYFQSDNNNKRIIANAVKNSGKNSQRWLYVSDNTDTLATGTSTTIDVEFNATNVYGGIYMYDLLVNSNDPNMPQVAVPCTLTVTGTPAIQLSQMAFEFDTLMVGATQTLVLTVNNVGTDSLFINSITSTDGAFTTNISDAAIYGGDSYQIEITFAPGAINNYVGALNISTNVGNFSLVLTGVGVGAPITTVDPAQINITLNTGESTQVPVTITNTGEGPLDYTITVPNLMPKPKFLAFLPTDNYDTYFWTALLKSVNQFYGESNYELKEFKTYDAEDFAAELATSKVLVIPYLYEWNGTILPFLGEVAPIIANFVQKGGTVLLANAGNANVTNTIGVLNITSQYPQWPYPPVVVEDPQHPLAAGLPAEIAAANISIYPMTLNGANNFQTILSIQDTLKLVGFEKKGDGNVVYMGFYPNDFTDFELLTPEQKAVSRAFANAWKYAGEDNLVNWMALSGNGGTVGYPDSKVINLNFESGNLLGGVYETTITINNNDPLQPTITIPVTLTIIGVPKMELITQNQQNTFDFGNVIIGNTKSISFDIKSIGTDDLVIQDISTNLTDFNIQYDYNSLDPGNGMTVTVTFAPTQIQNYDGTLTVTTNAETKTLNILANGIGAPNGSYTPQSIELTLLSGDSATQPITISNNGAGVLEFTTNADATKDIVVLKYGVNAFNYPLVLGALNALPGNVNITEFNSSNPADLQQALLGKDVLFIPQMEWTLTQFMNEAQATLKNFVDNGGSVIFSNNYCTDCMNSTGLFNTFNYGGPWGENINIINTNHPITAGLPEQVFIANGGANGQAFTNTDITTLSTYQYSWDPNTTFSVIAFRNQGAGKVVYFGWDFQYQYPELQQAFEQLMGWAGGAPSWINLTPTQGSTEIGETTTLDLTIDADNMLAGVYQFNLTIITNEPDNPVIVIPITLTVEAFPQSIMQPSKTLVCKDGLVTFKDQSINYPTSWNWDFGDGGTSTDQNPAHTYTQDGIYDIQLITCNNIGCDTMKYDNLITVDFSQEFCDTIYTKNGLEETYTFCKGMLYDNGGEDGKYADGVNSTVTIAPPGASAIKLSFEYINMEACCDYIQLFKGSTISTQNLIGQYSGNSLPNGDGVIVVESPAITIFMYSNAQLNYAGFKAKFECIVVEGVPSATFNQEVTDQCLGKVQFTSTSNNFPNSYEWDFGDGSTISTQANPIHEFPANGTYSVKCKACNAQYGCNEYTKEVTVTGVLTPLIEISTPIEVGKPITFKNNTPNTVSILWKYGNGGQSTNIVQATTVYNQVGNYTLTVTITNADGCTRTITMPIIVGAVGVNNTANITQPRLILAPNPATDKLYIQYLQPNPTNAPITLTLTDITGKTVFTEQKTINTTLYQKELNVQNLPKGMYLVTIQNTQGFKTTQKVTVQ